MSGTVNDQAAGLGDDDARPDAGDPQQQQPPANQPEQQQPQAEAAAPLDPDEAEYRAALAAVEAEQTAASQQQDEEQQPAQPQQQPPAAPPPQAQGAQQQPPQQQRPRVVPYDRFADVNRRLQEERDRRQYLEGALAATRGGPASNGQPQPEQQEAPPPDPIADQIQALRKQQKDLMAKVDTGEMLFAEVEEQRGQIEDRIADLRQQRAREAQQTVAPAPESLADQAIEQAHLTSLYQRFPYAASLDDQQALRLADLARQELALEGQPDRGTKADTLRLRERVAMLSNTWGPKWGLQPSRPVTTNQPQQQQPSTQPQGQPPLSPAAKARQAAMGKAAALPPDPAAMGMAASAGGLTDAQIASMDDEAIAALPAHVRHRILQSTA